MRMTQADETWWLSAKAWTWVWTFSGSITDVRTDLRSGEMGLRAMARPKLGGGGIVGQSAYKCTTWAALEAAYLCSSG